MTRWDQHVTRNLLKFMLSYDNSRFTCWMGLLARNLGITSCFRAPLRPPRKIGKNFMRIMRSSWNIHYPIPPPKRALAWLLFIIIKIWWLPAMIHPTSNIVGSRLSVHTLALDGQIKIKWKINFGLNYLWSRCFGAARHIILIPVIALWKRHFF